MTETKNDRDTTQQSEKTVGDEPDARRTVGPAPGYPEIRQAAASAVVIRSIIRLEGADTFDYLHRMTTNDMLTLGDGETRRTVFVNEKGRVIDIATVLRTGDSAVIIGSPGCGHTVTEWLAKFIIMDDVRLSSSPPEKGLPALCGPEIPAILGTLAPSGDSGSARPERTTGIGVIGGTIIREDLGSVPLALFVSDDLRVKEGSISSPDAPWAGQNIPHASAAAFETVRIEESVPVHGRELGPDVNALEAGLKQHISFSKGCYIGQEVIARLDTYRKLQNILTLFILPDHDRGTLSPGKVFHEGVEAGRITSTTWSPIHRAWIGLGYRKMRLLDGTFDFLQDDEQGKIPCRCVTRLPRGYEEYEVQE